MQRIFSNKKRIWSFLSYVFVMIALTDLLSMRAYAAPSWIRAGESDVYGSSGISQGADVEYGEEEEQDSIIKHANKFLLYISDQSREMKEGNEVANLSMDSIVFGRLAGRSISIGKFELYNGNPYGIVGAYGYRLIRNVIYGVLLIYYMVLLADQLIVGGAKKRAELKEVTYNLLFIFGMLQFMPVFINTFTILRDELIVLLADAWGIDNFSGLDSVFETLGDSEDLTFATGLLSIGYFWAPIFYLGSYVSNSLLAMGFFILFPYVLLRSMKNKTLFVAWCGNFFSYVAFPFIDFLFLSVPLLMKSILRDTGFTGTTAYMVMCIMFIWAVIPTRNGIMRFLGNFVGATPSNGFAALAGMAMMAMRGAGHGGRGGAGNGERGGFFADMANANKYDSLAANMNSSIAEATNSANSIGGLESLLKSDDGSMRRIEDITGEPVVASSGASMTAEADAEALKVAGGAGGDVMPEGETLAVGDSANTDNIELTEGDMPEVESAGGMSDVSVDDVMLAEDMNTAPAISEPTMNEYGELVMPDSDNQREQLENRRLENLDRMDRAQQVVDYQQGLVADYKQQIASVAKEGADDMAEITSLTKSTADRRKAISGLESSLADDRDSLSLVSQGSSEYKNIQQRIADKTKVLEQLGSEQTVEEKKLADANKAYQKNYGNRIQELEKQQKTAEATRDKAQVLVEQRKTQESSYANLEKLYGGNGEIFNNKSQYAEAVRNREIEKRSMTYRNFDSSANVSLLSPQEKAEFHRKRMTANLAKSAVTKTAGIAVGTIGAASLMYGGPQATMMGAAGGYMLGKGVSSKAISTGEDIKHAGDSVENKAVVKGYHEQDPIERGEREFSAGGTKKVVRNSSATSNSSGAKSPLNKQTTKEQSTVKKRMVESIISTIEANQDNIGN